MNPIREKIEYLLLCGLIGLLKILPIGVVTLIFRAFGALFFLLSPRRRRITQTNLKIAFPEKKPSECRHIAWRAFQNVALSTRDSFLVMANRIDPNKIFERVDGTDLEKYRDLKSNTSRGIMHITAHLGNWELMAQYGALQGLESHVVARKGTNRLIDERIIVPMRTRYGNKVFYKQNALIHTVKALKRGETVSFLIDQKINEKEGVPVTFFGQEILAVAACAVLQIRFHPTVIPVFMVRKGSNRYKLVVGDPIPWQDDGSSQEEQIRTLTQTHQTAIEKMIRQYPDQWFWMHDRWKIDASFPHPNAPSILKDPKK